MLRHTKVILALILLIKSARGAHENKVNGDVIVTYSGHSDVVDRPAGPNEVKNPALETGSAVEAVPSAETMVVPEAKTPEDKGCTCGTSSRLAPTESTDASKLTSKITESSSLVIKLPTFETIGILETNRRSGSETFSHHGTVTEAPEEIVFIPNEREIPSDDDDDYLNHAEKTVGDLFIRGRTLDDLIRGNGKINMEPDHKNLDRLFITGKNNDEAETEIPHKKESGAKRPMTPAPLPPVNCNSLSCNNKVSAPVCGAKMEKNKWRFRSFLNLCFFNRVNCGFNQPTNKYIKVDNNKCTQMSRNRTPRPQSYNPAPPRKMGQGGGSPEQFEETRRVFQSRRSSSLDLNGRYCSHMCPIACPEVYAPECAISSLGQKRVFVNHCQLDFNSCQQNLMWQTRPLADCVGQDAAEVSRNRAFIAWMQNIGIIDNKGRFNKE